MSIRNISILAFLGVLAACGSSDTPAPAPPASSAPSTPSAAAAKISLPAAFAREGKVCNTSGNAGTDHLHELASWKVKADESRIVVRERSSGARYIEVLGSEGSKLQEADFLVINESSNPVASQEEYPNGCDRNVEPKAFKAQGEIPDFVFAFAVASVPNGPDASEPASPHAVIYLPINIGRAPATDAQEFQVLLFHMQPAKDDCPEAQGLDREQCVALWELRSMWDQGGHTEEQKKQAVATKIRAILKVAAEIPNPLPARSRNSYGTYFLSEARYHNGVIHGTY